MPNLKYVRSANAERELVRRLEAAGYYAVRSAGSHKGDVTACVEGRFWVYSVKHTAQWPPDKFIEEYKRLAFLREKRGVHRCFLAIRCPRKGWLILAPNIKGCVRPCPRWAIWDVIQVGGGIQASDLKGTWLDECPRLSPALAKLAGRYQRHGMFSDSMFDPVEEQ